MEFHGSQNLSVDLFDGRQHPDATQLEAHGGAGSLHDCLPRDRSHCVLPAGEAWRGAGQKNSAREPTVFP